MISEIIEAINEGRSFLITAHVRLDGDALGSELAMYLMLKKLGKDVVVYNQDHTPERYLFIPAAQNIVHDINNIEQYDVCIVLDCSELHELEMKRKTSGKSRN